MMKRISFFSCLLLILFTEFANAGVWASTTNSNGKHTIRWSINSSAEYYAITVRKDSKSIASYHSFSSTSREFTHLENGIYEYSVSAVPNEVWNPRIGEWVAGKLIPLGSVTVTVKLQAPPKLGNLTAPTNSSNGSFTLSWPVPSGIVSRYEVYRQINNGAWSPLNGIGASSTKISGLSTGAWDFKVRACNSTGCGAFSNERRVNVARTPNTPASIVIKDITSGTVDREGRISVDWSAPGSGSAVTGYQIQQCKDSCSSWTQIYSSASTATGPTPVPASGSTPLTNGTYKYRVRAYAKGGSYVTYSGWRNSSSVTVSRQPDTVRNFTQPDHGTQSSSFKVVWSEVTGSFDAVTRYELQCSINGGSYTYAKCGSSNLGTATSMEVTLNSSDPSGEYRFMARACNDHGCSGWTPSDSRKVVMVNVPLPAPDAPKFTSFPSDSEFGDYDLSWSEPSLTWTSFELQRERRNDPDTNCGNSCWKVVSGNLEERTYSARGDIEDKYRYRVRACNGLECSGWTTSDWIDVHNLEGIEPAVSLAIADTPGTANYSANVNYEGDAVISIPVEVAPGVNNLVPSLSLQYSGARYRERNNEMLPEDILGYGWRLSGLQEIRRCVKNRPNTDRIKLDDTDSLCLNGQPLVLVSGEYWASGSKYRKLRDDFSLIELKETGGQPWFLVHKPNGEVHEFGNTNNSRIRAGKNPSFAWSINKVTDAFGNSITYQYHLDTVEGINYPLEITYGNGNDARIEFAYGTRSDAPPQPLASGEIEQEQLVLLHHINIYLDNKLLREYRLITEPEPASKYSQHYRRLQQVQLCGYDKHGTGYQCLNPLIFNWEEVNSSSDLDLDTGIWQIIDGLGKATRFYHTTVREVTGQASASGNATFLERPFGDGVLPENAKNLEADNGDYRTVVGEVHRSNGLANGLADDLENGWHKTKYYYQGVGVVSTKGWGFLGFYAQKIHDLASDIVTYRQFRQDFPHFGKVARKLQFQGSYGSHAQKLADERHRYSVMELSTGLDKSYYPFLEKSVETLIEKNQVLGYRSLQNSFGKRSFGTLGELLENQTSVEKTAKSLSGAADQDGLGGITTPSFGQTDKLPTLPTKPVTWGEVSDFSLSGIERSREIFTSFENRVGNGQWLVGFASGLELREYDGGPSGAPDRTHTVVSLPYLSTNKVATRVSFPDDADLKLSTDFDYDTSGNLVSESTSGAHVETRTTSATDFVDNRYPGTLTNALDQKVSLTYDHRFGLVSEITDSNIRTTSVQYDAFGREIEKTNTDGVVFNTTYSECFAGTCPVAGNILAAYKIIKDSSISPKVELYYDLLGRIVQQDQKAFDGTRIARREFNYDLQGHLYLETDPFYLGENKPLTIYHFDIKDRIEKITSPDGSEVRTKYYPDTAQKLIRVEAEEDILDSNGNLVETQARHHYYNISGSQVKVVEAVGTNKQVTTEYDYYGSGLLKSVLVNNDLSTKASFFYDNAGNSTKTIDPAFGTVVTHYNGLGQIREQINNKGDSLSYLYDKLGRMREQVDALGVASWTYDAANAIGSIANRSYSQNGLTLFSEDYIYNSAGQLQDLKTSLQAGDLQRNYQHTYGYDNSGRLDKLVYPSGAEARYHYNNQGFLSEITDGISTLKTFKDRDASGKILEFTFGNSLTTKTNYDPNTGRITSINTAAGSIQNNIYKWRSNGTLESRLSISGANKKEERFSYDALNRLEGSETLLNGSHLRSLSTLYDSLGNILSKSATGNVSNQVTGYQYEQVNNAGPNAVTQVNINGVVNNLGYDQNGSLTRYDAAVGNDRWITWNARQLAEEITLGSAQDTATPTARDRFQYGPNGQRYYRESSWWDESQQKLMTEKAFIVGDYEDLLPANDPDYQQIEKVQIGGDILQVSATDHLGIKVQVFEFLHRDYLGSIEKVTDESGAVILDTAFDPFGARKKSDWSGGLSKADIVELIAAQGLSTKRGFTGHEHLDRTGLVHMNGRIYDPTLGRFLSPDPIVQFPSTSQNWNRYSYVLNNPLSFVDPSGFEIEHVQGWGYKYNGGDMGLAGALSGPVFTGGGAPLGRSEGGKSVSSSAQSNDNADQDDDSDDSDSKDEKDPEEVVKTASCEDYKRAGMSCDNYWDGNSQCSRDICARTVFTFKKREQIERFMSDKNMIVAIKSSFTGIVAGAALMLQGMVGSASLLGGELKLKEVFGDTQVSYVPQIGDTITTVVTADAVNAFHSETGMNNVNISVTITNGKGEVISHQEGGPTFW
jgi:RHS repeat-associated protein